MSRNTVHEGWLTKSPPNRRIWRTRWRRRWFSLRQSGELPGQYFLDYYADRNCRRLKGTIDLDLCEQVDAGLRMERNSHAPFNPKIRGSVFTIQTQRRTYHLEADCESEMGKWVDAICRVCGLRSTQESSDKVVDTNQSSPTNESATNNQYESIDGTGPYIPISECITGVRAQDEQRAFTFDPKNIVMSTRHDGQQLFSSQSHFRLNSAELSDNDSTLSDEEEVSLHASHQNIYYSVTKSFTKLSVSPKKNGGSEEGPPVPPRPPKTLAVRNRDVSQKDPFQGPKIQEPTESSAYDNAQQHLQQQQQHLQQQQLQQQQLQQQQQQQRLRVPRRMSQGAPASPVRLPVPVLRTTDDEEEAAAGQASMQYCNLPSLPPAVDRALKPRHSSGSVGHINAITPQGASHQNADEMKPDTLQYLDLDLHTSKPSPSKGPEQRKVVDITHGKPLSSIESDSAYKTVDFLKTEAFNSTRQDAEASRSFQY